MTDKPNDADLAALLDDFACAVAANAGHMVVRAKPPADAMAARARVESAVASLAGRAERAKAERDRAVETLRLTRDGGDLLVGAEEERQAMEAKLREACGGSEPSAGHDWADEAIGLLRVTRSQRDDADRLWNEARSAASALRARVEALEGALRQIQIRTTGGASYPVEAPATVAWVNRCSTNALGHGAQVGPEADTHGRESHSDSGPTLPPPEQFNARCLTESVRLTGEFSSRRRDDGWAFQRHVAVTNLENEVARVRQGAAALAAYFGRDAAFAFSIYAECGDRQAAGISAGLRMAARAFAALLGVPGPDEARAALAPSAATCSFCNGEGVITRAFAEPHDVPCPKCVGPSAATETTFADCVCYVVNGKITDESRARCPRHTASAATETGP